jgi:coatomer protein complex subunit gamma
VVQQEAKADVKGDEKDSKIEGDGKGVISGGSSAAPTATAPHLELLNSINEIKELGAIWKSSEPVDLTESETEYVVTCIKHVYPKHILFQFNITNGMESQLLENVSVAMEPSDDSWSEEFLIPIASLKPKANDYCFVALQRPSATLASGTISCTLKFTVKDYDAATGDAEGKGVEDEYQLEDAEVTEADYMQPGEDIGLVEFRRQWESLGEGKEAVKKYSLGLDTLQGAVDAVVDLLGLRPRENSGKVPADSKSHTVNLSGVFYGNVPVLARAGFLLDAKPSVTLKIAVRSPDNSVSKLLTNAIR